MEKGDLEALQDLPRPVSVSGAKGMKKIKKSKNCEIKTQGGRYIVLMKEEKKKKKSLGQEDILEPKEREHDDKGMLNIRWHVCVCVCGTHACIYKKMCTLQGGRYKSSFDKIVSHSQKGSLESNVEYPRKQL